MVTHGVDLRCVRPEDIAILYRSPNKVLLHLTKALDEGHGALAAWRGRRTFSNSTEGRAALAFLQVIDNPREDVPLIAVLRSPVYGFTGDQLALLRAHCPEGDFYQCVQHGAESGDSACVDFLDELNRLRLLAPDLSAAQLLWELYDRTGLLGIFGSMAGGQLSGKPAGLLPVHPQLPEQRTRRAVRLCARFAPCLGAGQQAPRRAGTAGTGSANHVHPQIQGIGVPRGGAGGAVPKV